MMQKIRNFRDFGGSVTTHGRRVVQGRLFRAAHPGDATDTDLQTLAALGVALVVDLRQPREREREPSRIAQSPTVTVISSDLGAEVDAPHVAFLQKGDLSDAAVRRFMLDFYTDAADEPRHRALFGETLAALPGLSGSLLVHCAAGKDRTGILVALIQTILGVPEADMMQDYLRTNAEMLTPERFAATTTYLQAQLGRPPGEAVVQVLLGVDAAFLAQAMHSIATRHGSIEAYLDGLGIDAEVRALIRERFTAQVQPD